MKVKMTITGVEKTIKKFKRFGEEGEKVVEQITSIKAKEIEAEAKRLAPVDKGFLRQNIVRQQLGELSHQIIAFAPYAAYQEFGTGRLISIPSELTELAAKFKGKGIKQINMRPQPFMYPSFLKAKATYAKDLDFALNQLTNRYNG